jgi:hypothetical protein
VILLAVLAVVSLATVHCERRPHVSCTLGVRCGDSRHVPTARLQLGSQSQE